MIISNQDFLFTLSTNDLPDISMTDLSLYKTNRFKGIVEKIISGVELPSFTRQAERGLSPFQNSICHPDYILEISAMKTKTEQDR
ncbi:MAG: hypothetical protein C0399_05740 [Syntrophus sp. (in: bacteria)]|nr:hypothetical protein [Syntrophus sp. (in: bacteria)]